MMTFMKIVFKILNIRWKHTASALQNQLLTMYGEIINYTKKWIHLRENSEILNIIVVGGKHSYYYVLNCCDVTPENRNIGARETSFLPSNEWWI
jgi:hypothetical protein